MRKLTFYKTLIALAIFTILMLIFKRNTSSDILSDPKRNKSSSSLLKYQYQQKVSISFVVCENRYHQALNLVKSVLIFTNSPVLFIIFCDDTSRPRINETLIKWQALESKQVTFELHNISFPKEREKDWMNLFTKCSAQRLFFPELIAHHDAVIYVDTDVIFLGPAEELWSYFAKFNSTQIMALAIEHDNPNVSWYPRFARHPFYGSYGLNSGVILMNLTRMRTFDWVDYLTPVMLKWQNHIPWGDQDIINIILHYHSEAAMVLPCRYNYRTDQCMYGDACAAASRRGASLLHASRGAQHSDNHPAFQVTYRAIDEHQLGKDTVDDLLQKLDKYISQIPNSNCGSLKKVFVPQRLNVSLPP